jgi:hypothetical protein
MPKKKKRFAHAQRFVKKHNLALSLLMMILSLILPLFFGQELDIIKTVHKINLDVIDAYAHPSDSVTISDSVIATIQNTSGTYRLNDSANTLIQNASGTNTRSVGLSDSVTMTVQNSSGTYTFQGS